MMLPLETMTEPTDYKYKCYNEGGVECEVGDFLYGLVRAVKPMEILETGTHKGISATYMAQALKENGFGKITTVEFEKIHWDDAQKLFKDAGVSEYVNSVLSPIENFNEGTTLYDFIFLDTEPQLRFNEFLRFYKNLRPGGFIAIHDLHPHMAQTGTEAEGMMNWPYGVMPEEMRRILKEEVQNFHPRTPRGFYIGQKRDTDFFKP